MDELKCEQINMIQIQNSSLSIHTDKQSLFELNKITVRAQCEEKISQLAQRIHKKWVKYVNAAKLYVF